MSRDWGLAQEPVYGRDGGMVGTVVYDEHQRCWRAWGERGELGTFGSRPEAERALRGQARGGQVARRPQVAAQQPELGFDQVAGAVMAGAALFGGLAALLGGQEQPARANDQADELRRQNDELRRQNDLLRQALGQLGPQGITKRR